MIQLSDSYRSQLPDARQALEQAEILCQQRGTRLTDLRRRVLEIIWNNPTPLGAYAILDVLRDDGRQGAPPRRWSSGSTAHGLSGTGFLAGARFDPPGGLTERIHRLPPAHLPAQRAIPDLPELRASR